MHLTKRDLDYMFINPAGLDLDPALPSDISATATIVRSGLGQNIIRDIITFTSPTTLNDGADAASIGDGIKLLDFNAVPKLIVPMWARVSLVLSDNLALGETTAGEIGVGTSKGGGSVSVLGGTAGFENFLTGQTLGNIAAGSTVPVGAQAGAREPIGSVLGYDVYLNHASAFSNEASSHGVVIDSGTIELVYGVIG